MTEKNTEIDYQKLASEIVKEQNRQFITFEEVCAIIGYAGYSSTARQIRDSSDFPKPTRLTETGHCRWFKKDIFDWVERQRLNRSKVVMAAANQVA